MSEQTNFINLSQFEEPIIQGDTPVFDPAATGGGFRPVPENPKGYLCRLKFVKESPGEQWAAKKDGEQPLWLYTSLVAEILEGDYEGRKIRDGYVSTMTMNDGSTAVNKVLHALGEPVTAEEVAQFGAHRAQAIKLSKVLAGEPTVKVFVQWTAKWLTEEDGKKVTVKVHDEKKGKYVDLVIRGASKSAWPKDNKGEPKVEFTLRDAFSDAEEGRDLPATVDAVVSRYAPAVN